jgi:N-acetylglutamate synthase-like GNAT family acetyltransferase
VGLIRGGPRNIGNLFVSGRFQRKGIGRRLVESFEREARRLESKGLHVQSTLYATPFYQTMGFKRTTGVRNLKGHKMQPMMKIF